MSGNNETLMQISKLVAAGAEAGQGFSDYSAGKANAKTLQQQAAFAAMQAASREAVVRDETQQIIGQQYAAIGASGLTAEGSPSDVIRQNAVERELEALNERYAGQIQVVGFLSQAAEAKRQATEALYSGIAKSGTSLLMAGSTQPKPVVRRPTAAQVATLPMPEFKLPTSLSPSVSTRQPLVRI